MAVSLGVPLGLVAGYFGGWIDQIIPGITDAMLAMPFLILAIALAAFLGPSLTNAMIAIGLLVRQIFIRLTRGQVLSVKASEVDTSELQSLMRLAFALFSFKNTQRGKEIGCAQ